MSVMPSFVESCGYDASIGNVNSVKDGRDVFFVAEIGHSCR